MDPDRVRTVVLADALPPAFEAACLVRCTEVAGLPGRRRPQQALATPPVVAPRGVLAEFDQPAAAARLTALLTGLGFPARHDVHSGGNRWSYDVQRVLLPESRRAAATAMMATAWRQGRQSLLDATPLGGSSPRHTQRLALAYTAWRAVLLAGGRRRRTDRVRVHLGNHDLATVLVRAARLLEVRAEVISRPGCLMVAVPAADAAVLEAPELISA
ncbi:hypothetical protein [Winogradskya humida]|uniref:Uncharacterized protein n=1 Tax=Winogradskya humida TaxID=113566 RepID=A0ABQ4A6V7_9ACTN|nr:hypothetical protein [Actinoplanes humidus]GIE26047.1 hypothetical protein Ahu01nite_091490 [Actinoplanes humidus]